MRTKQNSGFTLVELVMVIILLGIVGGILAPMIAQSAKAFSDTELRTELTSKGRLALERLARTARQAVPNSMRTIDSGQGVEFVRSRAGGRYVTKTDVFDFTTVFLDKDKRFKKNSSLDEGLYKVGTDLKFKTGDLLIIANTSPNDLTAAKPTVVALTGTDDTLFSITDGVDDGTDKGQILAFASHKFPNDSSGKHFAIADNVVEVGLDGTTIRWYESPNQMNDYDNGTDYSNGDPILVDTVSSLNFDYSAGTASTNAILRIALTLTDGDESIDLYQEVHIKNTP
ncbi:MAG: prepilin-type N-terminal cleavage/methylation domain-containing protein [Gammaproteobacteria bacterium]|nr:prepilin-type N-terminal cleavage/methylation domain-containing protein [Gammaproteobacteria bacterium]